MESPPEILNESRVLEFVVFDKDVQRTALMHFDAGPGEPKPAKAMAICQSLNEDSPEVLYLYYCLEDWSVDREQAWNWPGGGPEADTTEALRSHASTVFTGLEGKWVDVAPIQKVYPTKKRLKATGLSLRKWWQFWR